MSFFVLKSKEVSKPKPWRTVSGSLEFRGAKRNRKLIKHSKSSQRKSDRSCLNVCVFVCVRGCVLLSVTIVTSCFVVAWLRECVYTERNAHVFSPFDCFCFCFAGVCFFGFLSWCSLNQSNCQLWFVVSIVLRWFLIMIQFVIA